MNVPMKLNESGHIWKSLKNIQMYINSYVWGNKREQKKIEDVSRFPGGGTIVLVQTAFSSYKPQKK